MGLERVYGKKIIQRGENYIDNVAQCTKIGNFLYADVIGTGEYKTNVNLETLEGNCSCPFGHNCKHAVAAFLYHKQGKSNNADGFIEHLEKLGKEELIKIIVENLPKNPEIAVDFTVKKTTNVSELAKNFTEDFSYQKMRQAELLADSFSFRQLMRMVKFLDKHEYDGFEKLYPKIYEHYGYDDESNVFYDFREKLVQAMVKKISSESELKEAIKNESAGIEIIDNAEQFLRFKQTIKKQCSKDNYLSFLLNLKNPELNEVQRYINNDNLGLLWSLPKNNIGFAERLGKHLKNKALLFLVALEKNDCDSVVKYFGHAAKVFKSGYALEPGHVVEILAKNNVKNEKIAKKLLKKQFFGEYSKEQLNYLAEQINDFDLIEKELSSEFSESQPLFERLISLDKEMAKTVICKPNSLEGKSLEDATDMVLFVKNMFGRKTLVDFIESNEERLATASALKNRLKEEGIFISLSQGEFVVKVEN